MTRHVIPHKDNPLDSGQSEIRALYREGAGTAEPSSKLDSVILDAARAELKDDNVGYRRRASRAVGQLARHGAPGY